METTNYLQVIFTSSEGIWIQENKLVLGYLEDVFKFTKNHLCHVVIFFFTEIITLPFANWHDKQRQSFSSSITTSKIKFNSNCLLRQKEQMG